jgi:hypothetical protein
MLPSFFLIGAQKSASSFLHDCLREHPNIYMPKEETPFFEDPYYDPARELEFEALFDHVNQDKQIGIKRPDYLARQECSERIARLVPDARFLLVLRNPIERAVSAYYWYLKQGYLPFLPLEQGMDNLLNGNYKSSYPKSQEILDYGFYYQHINRYLTYFDRDQMFISLHEDFKNKPLEMIRDVYSYLGVDENQTPKTLTKTPKKTVYSLPRLKWLKLRNPFIHDYQYYDENMVTLTPKWGAFSTTVKAFFFLVDRAFLAPFFKDSKPNLSHDLQHRLLDLYHDDILGTEAFLGRDLSKWKQIPSKKQVNQ